MKPSLTYTPSSVSVGPTIFLDSLVSGPILNQNSKVKSLLTPSFVKKFLLGKIKDGVPSDDGEIFVTLSDPKIIGIP